ncbi:hypothetical protein [Streptomyces sp. NPDC054808]
MEPADLLDQHGIKPAGLETMPAPPARRETLPRVQETLPRSCVVGGAPAAAARVVRFAGAGPHWVDLCWDDGMAVCPRCCGREKLEGIAANLRAAAQEAGVPGHRRCRSILRSKRLLVAARPETR